MTFGHNQEMTLTLILTSLPLIILINSISCLQISTFMSQAAIVLLFPIGKPKLQNLTMPLNKLRSTQGHHLNKL